MPLSVLPSAPREAGTAGVGPVGAAANGITNAYARRPRASSILRQSAGHRRSDHRCAAGQISGRGRADRPVSAAPSCSWGASPPVSGTRRSAHTARYPTDPIFATHRCCGPAAGKMATTSQEGLVNSNGATHPADGGTRGATPVSLHYQHSEQSRRREARQIVVRTRRMERYGREMRQAAQHAVDSRSRWSLGVPGPGHGGLPRHNPGIESAAGNVAVPYR